MDVDQTETGSKSNEKTNEKSKSNEKNEKGVTVTDIGKASGLDEGLSSMVAAAASSAAGSKDATKDDKDMTADKEEVKVVRDPKQEAKDLATELDLVSSDNAVFKTNRLYAKISTLVKTSLENDDEAKVVPVPGVKKNSLEEVIKYMVEHKGIEPPIVDKPLRSKVMKDVVHHKPDADYIDRIGEARQELYDLILAANYMDIKSLLHLGCAKVASLIKGQPLEKIKEILDPKVNNKKDDKGAEKSNDKAAEKDQTKSATSSASSGSGSSGSSTSDKAKEATKDNKDIKNSSSGSSNMSLGSSSSSGSSSALTASSSSGSATAATAAMSVDESASSSAASKSGKKAKK